MSGIGWQPRVGDRVRVRLVRGRLCEEMPHLSVEEGVTGRVSRQIDWAPTHPYFVVFDAPLAWPVRAPGRGDAPMPLPGRPYRADELEPLGEEISADGEV